MEGLALSHPCHRYHKSMWPADGFRHFRSRFWINAPVPRARGHLHIHRDLRSITDDSIFRTFLSQAEVCALLRTGVWNSPHVWSPCLLSEGFIASPLRHVRCSGVVRTIRMIVTRLSISRRESKWAGAPDAGDVPASSESREVLRVIELPAGVVPGGASVTMEGNTLVVHLPKAAESSRVLA